MNQEQVKKYKGRLAEVLVQTTSFRLKNEDEKADWRTPLVKIMDDYEREDFCQEVEREFNINFGENLIENCKRPQHIWAVVRVEIEKKGNC